MLCLVQVARGLQQQDSLDAFRLALFMVMLSGGAAHSLPVCVWWGRFPRCYAVSRIMWGYASVATCSGMCLLVKGWTLRMLSAQTSYSIA